MRYARRVEPLAQGELEITDLQMRYLQLARSLSSAWGWDLPGTIDLLIDAGMFVQTLQKRQGMKLACLEEVAFRHGFIDRDQVLALAQPLEKSGCARYLNENHVASILGWVIPKEIVYKLIS